MGADLIFSLFIVLVRFQSLFPSLSRVRFSVSLASFSWQLECRFSRTKHKRPCGRCCFRQLGVVFHLSLVLETSSSICHAVLQTNTICNSFVSPFGIADLAAVKMLWFMCYKFVDIPTACMNSLLQFVNLSIL